ncbi:Gfo/Idh/MocA family oxidoreductase [bacterium]|nr:Gfo/Idh/MocA family oxidoreductase [bacterium]
MNKIKVGVIGVGRLGRFHTQKYAALQSAELVGVFDQDIERAESVAIEVDSSAFSNVEELLQNVDAVSIATPTTTHYATGLLALEHGCHILMEKPITDSSSTARELVDIARKQGLFIQVGHIERFNPAVTALRDIRLDPLFVEAHRLAPYTSRGADVSVVHDLMIHDIDVLLHWMGNEVERVDAAGVPVISKTADIANTRITFSRKRIANLTASRISVKQMRKFRMFQQDAYISMDFIKKRAEIYKRVEKGTLKSIPIPGAGDSDQRILIKRTRAKKNEDALAREIQAFIRSIQENSVPIVSGEDALTALEVVEEIARQCESG